MGFARPARAAICRCPNLFRHQISTISADEGFGGFSFVFADDGSRFHLLERSEAPETAFEAGFLRLADGGAVAQYSRVERDGARRHFRLLLFRKNDGALIATLLTASGLDALSLWGMGELHRLTPQ